MRPWAASMTMFLALLVAGHARPPMKWDNLMLLKAAAEQGDAQAQFLFGYQYRVGDGPKKDPVEAAKWIQRAAEGGYVEAQVALGQMYSTGEGVAQDPAKATGWFRAAAEQGDADAKLALQKMAPVAGAAVADVAKKNDEDPAETVRWSLILSGLRGSDALLVRGYLLENGIAMNRDPAAAVKYYRAAAEQGNAFAQLSLGSMYAGGRGVATDAVEACAWLELAAAAGSTDAAKALVKIKAAMTSAQREAATRLVEERSKATGLPKR